MIRYLIGRTIGFDLFRPYRQRRALQQALTQAYAAFKRRYPEWAASLFDEHFVKHALADGSVRLRPHDIADAWARQMTTHTDRRQALRAMALPVATEFIQLFEHALPAADATLLTLVHKGSRNMAAQQTITR